MNGNFAAAVQSHKELNVEDRMWSNLTGDGIQLHYKELVSDVGWLPRPVPVSDSFKSSWDSEFRCSKQNQGKPVRQIYFY